MDFFLLVILVIQLMKPRRFNQKSEDMQPLCGSRAVTRLSHNKLSILQFWIYTQVSKIHTFYVQAILFLYKNHLKYCSKIMETRVTYYESRVINRLQ